MRISRLYILKVLTGLGLLLASGSASALIPTVDFSAIGEGVKSNIELVKQSKIVTDATSLAGSMNATIGSAKASMSELGVEDAKAAAEKLQKEKENLEKAKEQYDKYKADVEAQKKELEDNKAKLEKYKNEAQSAVSDAKEVSSSVKSTLPEKKTSNPSTASDNNKPAPSTGRQAFTAAPAASVQDSVPQPEIAVTPQPQTSQSSAAELASAREEINRLQAELAALKAAPQTSAPNIIPAEKDETDVQTEEKTPETLEEAQAEIDRLKAELDKLRAEPAEENRAVMQNTPAAAVPADTGFRKRPAAVSTDQLYEKRVSADGLIHTASVFGSERLSFAKAEESSEDGGVLDLANVPTGKNAKTDEFIVSEKLAQYCNININETKDENVLKDCYASIIRYRTDPNAQTAAKGQALYNEIAQETVTALAAESLTAKNLAAQYQDEVLKKLQKDLASSATVREDVQALAQTNHQIQILLNEIIKLYAGQISLNATDSLSKYSAKLVEDPETDVGG